MALVLGRGLDSDFPALPGSSNQSLRFSIPISSSSPFYNADIFLRMAFSFRSVVISGRYGSGKTCLSLGISDRLIQDSIVSRCVSNTLFSGASLSASYYDSYEYAWLHSRGLLPVFRPFDTDDYNEMRVLRWGRDFSSLRFESSPVALYDSCVIFDEAHTVLGRYGSVDKKAFSAFTAFLRKRNLVCVFPSVLPLHPVLNRLVVRRSFNLFVLGFPAWIYRWDIPELKEGKKRFGGWFAFFPSRYFGAYDTHNEPPSVFDDTLVKLLLSGVRDTDISPVVDSAPAESVWNFNES